MSTKITLRIESNYKDDGLVQDTASLYKSSAEIVKYFDVHSSWHDILGMFNQDPVVDLLRAAGYTIPYEEKDD